MRDVDARFRQRAELLLQSQLSETERVVRLLDGQYATLTATPDLPSLTLLDEAGEALARLDSCRARLAPLLRELRSAHHDGPNSRSIRGALAQVEAEAGRARFAVDRLTLAVRRLADDASAELAVLGPGGRVSAYARAAGPARPAFETQG